jgi:hypothetical protein
MFEGNLFLTFKFKNYICSYALPLCRKNRKVPVMGFTGWKTEGRGFFVYSNTSVMSSETNCGWNNRMSYFPVNRENTMDTCVHD